MIHKELNEIYMFHLSICLNVTNLQRIQDLYFLVKWDYTSPSSMREPNFFDVLVTVYIYRF